MRFFDTCVRGLLVLALLPLLSACQDKRMVVTPEPGLEITMIVEQPKFWAPTVNVDFLLGRLPDCQRRVKWLQNEKAPKSVKLYRYEPKLYVLQASDDTVLLVDLHDCSMHSYQQVKDLKESDLLGRFAYRDNQGWRYDAETTPPSEPKAPAKVANKE